MNTLNWRAITLDDLPALVKLADECDALDGGLDFVNEPQSLKERVFPTPHLAASLGAFSPDGQLAAVTTINLTGDEKEMRAVIIGQVKPAYRRQGLGKHLMQWSETQAQILFSAHRSAKQILRIATESLTEHAHHLYTAHGFQCIYEALVMRRDLRTPLPNCPFPAGITHTNWRRELGEQFFQAYQAAFRERPGFPNPTAEDWLTDYFENENINSEWSLLALAGDTPAGFIFGSVERPGSYIVQIGVVPPHRQRGLGAALMVESLKRMQTAGITVAQLEVNTNNPTASKLYEQLGFTTIGRRAKYEREFNL